MGGDPLGPTLGIRQADIEINRKVMLDGPMVLLSCAGLLLYLWVRPLIAGDGSGEAPQAIVCWAWRGRSPRLAR